MHIAVQLHYTQQCSVTLQDPYEFMDQPNSPVVPFCRRTNPGNEEVKCSCTCTETCTCRLTPLWSQKSKIMIFSWQYWQNELFLENIPPPNVAIPHLLVYSRTLLVDFSAQKVNFKNFRFCPIVKPMISLYKLNTRGAGPISFHKLWNFWKSFSWYRHSICHYEWPTNSHFGNIRAA